MHNYLYDLNERNVELTKQIINQIMQIKKTKKTIHTTLSVIDAIEATTEAHNSEKTKWVEHFECIDECITNMKNIISKIQNYKVGHDVYNKLKNIQVEGDKNIN